MALQNKVLLTKAKYMLKVKMADGSATFFSLYCGPSNCFQNVFLFFCEFDVFISHSVLRPNATYYTNNDHAEFLKHISMMLQIRQKTLLAYTYYKVQRAGLMCHVIRISSVCVKNI